MPHARPVLAIAFSLLAAAAVSGQEAPFLGVQMDSSHTGEGVKVEQIIDGSAAGRIGLAAGDVIVEFDGRPVREFQTLAEWIRSRRVGEAVLIGIEREGKRLHLVPVLGDRDGAGVSPTPLADPLAAAFERLAWKAEARYLAGEFDEVEAFRVAATGAAEAHLAAAVAAEAEPARAGFEARIAGLRERLEWFACQARRKHKAPLCLVEPASDEEKAERAGAVARLVSRLDDPDFAAREAATRELLELGADARPDLERLLEASSLEAQHRIRDVLDALEPALDDADRPRQIRWPVEAEVVEFAEGAGRLAARHGAIRGPRLLQASLVHEDAPRGRVEFEVDAEGRFAIRPGSATTPAPGDRLVWIDVAREAD